MSSPEEATISPRSFSLPSLGSSSTIDFGAPPSTPDCVCHQTFSTLVGNIPYEGFNKHNHIPREQGGVLGFGSFGCVYRIDDTKVKHVCKEIRLIPIEQCCKPTDFLHWKSFLVEALTLRDVNHVNIVKFIEAYRTSTHGHIVLQEAKGTNMLTLLLQRTEQLRCPHFFEHVLRQIVSALSYLHSRGIAHRDIKPENISVTLDEEPLVTLLDFGSVHVHGMEEHQSIEGTTMYLSSELVDHALGFRQLTCADYAKADMYAVGILTHIALLGTHPYYVHRADTLESLQTKLSVPLPPTLEPTGSEIIDRILPRLLCKDSAARPSAEEVLVMLGEIPEKHKVCAKCARKSWTPLGA